VSLCHRDGLPFGIPGSFGSFLNFMFKNVTLVGNDWIEALKNLYITRRPHVTLVVAHLLTTFFPQSEATGSEYGSRYVSAVDSQGDSSSSSSRCNLRLRVSSKNIVGLGPRPS
jgi:hypothetical protein